MTRELWQHLQIDELSVSDCISLIAASSDNLATNILLTRVGLDAVSGCGRALGLTATSLNDYVRECSNGRASGFPLGWHCPRARRTDVATAKRRGRERSHLAPGSQLALAQRGPLHGG